MTGRLPCVPITSSQLRSHRCVSKAATHVSVALIQFLPSKLKHRLGGMVTPSTLPKSVFVVLPAALRAAALTHLRGAFSTGSLPAGELRTQLLWFRGTQLADWTSSPPLHNLRRLPARESTVVGQREEIDVPDVPGSVDVPLPERTTVWAHSYAMAGDATPTRHRRLSSSVTSSGSAKGSPDRGRLRLVGVTCSDAARVSSPRPPSQHRRVADGLLRRPRPRTLSRPDG